MLRARQIQTVLQQQCKYASKTNVALYTVKFHTTTRSNSNEKMEEKIVLPFIIIMGGRVGQELFGIGDAMIEGDTEFIRLVPSDNKLVPENLEALLDINRIRA